MGAAELFNKIASVYQEKFMDFNLYDDTYDTLCNLIPESDASILELACGPGNITRYLLRKQPKYRILATDLAPEKIKLAKVNNPTAEVELLDCRNIEKLNKRFDAIICGFCLPYFSLMECEKLMYDCSNLLHSQGLFYFSTIEGDYSNSLVETDNSDDKASLYYFSESELTQILDKFNFEVVKLFRKDYVDKFNIESVHLVFIARIKEF